MSSANARVKGPDKGYSWVIVICCAYMHFALFGLFRSAGVMYVALLRHYDVSREEASWPFSLCSAVFQLIGPGVSVLTYYMSQRRACLLGSAIATVGVVGCYFAESVMWINIFYGFIHGIGFGIVVTIIPVALNQYFVKHRATAIGIAFSGGTISSFIFPVAMEWMLENYGLNGSFLLLGGVVMNTLVASSLMRAPPWLKKPKHRKPKLPAEISDAKDSGVSTSVESPNDLRTTNGALPSTPLSLDKAILDGLKPEVDNCNIIDETQQDHCIVSENVLKNENLDTVYSNNDSLLFGGSNSKVNAISNLGKAQKNLKCDDGNRDNLEVREPLMGCDQVFILPKKNTDNAEKNVEKIKYTIPHSITNILKQPKFHLITFTMSVYFLGAHSFFMTIVDFAKDKGIPEGHGIYIISMFSITDLVGRAGLGWVTDRNYVSRKNMVILNLAAIGVLNQFYPVTNSLSGILLISAFHGLAVGSSITLFFILQAEYMGMKRLTLVVGLTSFIIGISTLLRPAMIGLFRDVIGSYNWMFHFLGIISLVFSMIWLMESWLTRDKKSPKSLEDAKM